MTTKTAKKGPQKPKKPNWEAIKKKATTHCTRCGSKRTFTNPFATCFYCKMRFCFDHINGGGIHGPGQKENDRIRDVCFACTKKLNHKFI